MHQMYMMRSSELWTIPVASGSTVVHSFFFIIFDGGYHIPNLPVCATACIRGIGWISGGDFLRRRFGGVGWTAGGGGVGRRVGRDGRGTNGGLGVREGIVPIDEIDEAGEAGGVDLVRGVGEVGGAGEAGGVDRVNEASEYN